MSKREMAKRMSKIAVLMSTYNGEQFIEEQLESLANQKCSHEVNIYIRDDGSSDRTISIIEKWKQNLKIDLFTGENLGPAYSFWELLTNKSIHADYYAFCDQDDIWDEDKLEIAVSHLNSKVHLYACNCRNIDADGNVIEEFWKKEKPEITLDKLFVSGIAQGCAMVFTDSLRNYILGKNITCITMHDLIVCMYGLTFGDFYWDCNPHFSYRFHNNNVVANKNRKGLAAKFATLKRWKKNKKRSLTQVAKELIQNTEIYDREQREFVKQLANAKVSIRSKIYLFRYKKIKSTDKPALKSFYFRILLNMI